MGHNSIEFDPNGCLFLNFSLSSQKTLMWLRYNIYYKQNRKRLVDETHAGFEDLVRLVAESWKNADEATKKEYLDLAKLDFERYTQEMTLYRDLPDVKGVLGVASRVGGERKFVGVNKRPLSVRLLDST